ncbi:MAG: hypothetical protein CL946_07685 [Ectothiorhodospiraceae bacterium]|nr:hypothetical protein [Ectothiorhodospiraceae bacterium]
MNMLAKQPRKFLSPPLFILALIVLALGYYLDTWVINPGSEELDSETTPPPISKHDFIRAITLPYQTALEFVEDESGMSLHALSELEANTIAIPVKGWKQCAASSYIEYSNFDIERIHTVVQGLREEGFAVALVPYVTPPSTSDDEFNAAHFLPYYFEWLDALAQSGADIMILDGEDGIGEMAVSTMGEHIRGMRESHGTRFLYVPAESDTAALDVIAPLFDGLVQTELDDSRQMLYLNVAASVNRPFRIYRMESQHYRTSEQGVYATYLPMLASFENEADPQSGDHQLYQDRNFGGVFIDYRGKFVRERSAMYGDVQSLFTLLKKRSTRNALNTAPVPFTQVPSP